MKLFLTIVAGIVVGVMLAVMLALWWIKRKIRNWAREMGDAFKGLGDAASGLPSFRLRLDPAPEAPWHHPEDGERTAAALRERGFVDAGRFTSDNSPGFLFQTMLHEADRIIAIIYEHPEKGVRVDLATDYVDGRHFVVTDVEEEHMDKPDWMPMVRMPGQDVGALLDHMLAERPAGDIAGRTVDEFRRVIEDAYAREMDWRVERGGYTDEEIRGSIEASGAEATDENFELVATMMRNALSSGLDEELREVFLRTSEMSATEWERSRHRIAIIHSVTSADEIEGHLHSLVEDGEDRFDDEADDGEIDDDVYDRIERRVAEALRQGGPRQVFAAIAATLPRAGEMRKLASIEAPVEADVYELPEEEKY